MGLNFTSNFSPTINLIMVVVDFFSLVRSHSIYFRGDRGISGKVYGFVEGSIFFGYLTSFLCRSVRIRLQVHLFFKSF